MLTRLRGADERDAGVTLVIAMMVMGVVSTLAVVVISVAISTNQASGRDRQRTVTVNAAEAGVDAVYAAIQSSGTTLPCRWPATGTSAMRAAPDKATTYATVSYFDSTGAAMTCSGTSLNATVNKPATAVVDGYGSAQPIAGSPTRTRHMQALINLTPIYGNSLNKAIFANSSLTFNNQTTLTGNSGPDADVYTNGNFVCANNQNFAGSVLAQGSITITGTLHDRRGRLGEAGRVEHVGVQRLDRWPGALQHRHHHAAGQLQRQRHPVGRREHLVARLLGERQVLRRTRRRWLLRRPSRSRSCAVTTPPWTSGGHQGYTVFDHTDCATRRRTGSSTRYCDARASRPSCAPNCAVSFQNDKNIPLSNDLAIFAATAGSRRRTR